MRDEDCSAAKESPTDATTASVPAANAPSRSRYQSAYSSGSVEPSAGSSVGSTPTASPRTGSRAGSAASVAANAARCSAFVPSANCARCVLCSVMAATHSARSPLVPPASRSITMRASLPRASCSRCRSSTARAPAASSGSLKSRSTRSAAAMADSEICWNTPPGFWWRFTRTRAVSSPSMLRSTVCTKPMASVEARPSSSVVATVSRSTATSVASRVLSISASDAAGPSSGMCAYHAAPMRSSVDACASWVSARNGTNREASSSAAEIDSYASRSAIPTNSMRTRSGMLATKRSFDRKGSLASIVSCDPLRPATRPSGPRPQRAGLTTRSGFGSRRRSLESGPPIRRRRPRPGGSPRTPRPS